MLLASGLAIIGGTLVLLIVRDGPFVAPTAPFDPLAIRSVLSSRGAAARHVRLPGPHVGAVCDVDLGRRVRVGEPRGIRRVERVASAGSMAAFVAIGSGAVGCGLGGLHRRSRRQGPGGDVGDARQRDVRRADLVVYGRSPMAALILIMVWGFTVVADSAQFSALVSEHAPRDHVGTALTLQTCVGFLLTMVTIELMPRVAAATGWRWASLLLVPGPLLGALAMSRLQPVRTLTMQTSLHQAHALATAST